MTEPLHPENKPYEDLSVNIRQVVLSLVVLLGIIVVSMTALWTWDVFGLRRPAAISLSEPAPLPKDVPPPRTPLDPDQRVNRERYEAEQKELLSSYGWVDKANGVARIPIEDAMEKYVQQSEGRH
jgi:hypothetical protein